VLGEIGNFYPSCSRTTLQLDKKRIADLVLFSYVFSMRRNKKNIILLCSHTTAQEEEVQGRHGGNPKVKPKSSHPTRSLWAASTLQT
jgi:hypothetical protein